MSTLAMKAIPLLAFSVSNIIKSIYGKNKKALVLDLDNTLWGGVIGDDGVDGIELGEETALGETYREFQSYLKEQKSIGVLLTVDSKNEEANALAGLRHPESVLRPEDFVDIRANWEPKSANFAAIAGDLNIGADSMVFVDDNPAGERERSSGSRCRARRYRRSQRTAPWTDRGRRITSVCWITRGISR